MFFQASRIRAMFLCVMSGFLSWYNRVETGKSVSFLTVPTPLTYEKFDGAARAWRTA